MSTASTGDPTTGTTGPPRAFAAAERPPQAESSRICPNGTEQRSVEPVGAIEDGVLRVHVGGHHAG
jgi:hypothetical protein